MTRTSLTHPLQIAEVRPAAHMGRIGLTFCPGKHQPGAMTGAWARDLDLDLDAIAAWNAAAVVTLIEAEEMQRLQVLRLGEGVAVRGMTWHHLPIRDVTAPGGDFEAAWACVGEGLRARLREGFNVLIHCKGGLGRAGTVAARLLVELGCDPERAIMQVRQARPGAIETASQERHVRGLQEVPEVTPETSLDAMRGRAVGAMLGLAVGDAIGTTLEFRRRDSQPLLTDMIGGGPFRLQPGEWTDDTAMALALGDSLETCNGLDEADLMRRFVSWHEEGTYSCTGTCFDIGITTRAALRRWQRTGDPLAGSTAPETAGNGSLMRLAPIAARFFRLRDELRDAAARQSRTTHAAPEAVDACVAWAELLADAINGRRRSEVLRRPEWTWAGRIGPILAGSWRGLARSEVHASGYVAHSLEAALWCVGRTGSFAEAVLLAANLGEDADTTAAITGQLAGALYGVEGIPHDWRTRVALGRRIEGMASRLFDAGLTA
jgi:ADP-ribosyl-[dinitrogen reductase] hydrolase